MFNTRLMSGIHVRLRRLSSSQLKVHDKVHPVEFSQLKSQKDIFRSPSEELDLKKRKKEKACVCIKQVFKWVSKVIRNCLGFTFLHSVIGPENLRHFLNQSDLKLKLIVTWSPPFNRASGSLFVYLFVYLFVFTMSSHYFLVIFAVV